MSTPSPTEPQGGPLEARSDRDALTDGLDAAARATLAGLADVLIPAGDGMPSASEAGSHEAGLDAVLHARPDLGPPLAALLAGAGRQEPAALVERLPDEDPAAWDVLTTVVPAAYFFNDDVRRRIGYAGQRAVPIDADASPDYLEDGLLDSVVARGTIYRPTP